jgi:hypothetical protein
MQRHRNSGVASAVISTSDPGAYFGDCDQAKALARDCNEYQARMAADHRAALVARMSAAISGIPSLPVYPHIAALMRATLCSHLKTSIATCSQGK